MSEKNYVIKPEHLKENPRHSILVLFYEQIVGEWRNARIKKIKGFFNFHDYLFEEQEIIDLLEGKVLDNATNSINKIDEPMEIKQVIAHINGVCRNTVRHHIRDEKRYKKKYKKFIKEYEKHLSFQCYENKTPYDNCQKFETFDNLTDIEKKTVTDDFYDTIDNSENHRKRRDRLYKKFIQ